MSDLNQFRFTHYSVISAVGLRLGLDLVSRLESSEIVQDRHGKCV